MKGMIGISNKRVGMDGIKKNATTVSRPKLVQRYVLSPASVGGYSTSVTVPYGAKYATVRCLGPGGSFTNVTSATISGGGGVYARSTFTVNTNDVFNCTLGSYNSASETNVKLSGVTLVSAGVGGQASGSANGVAGHAGIGDVVIQGGLPGQTDAGFGPMYFSGLPGVGSDFAAFQGIYGDAAYADTLHITGKNNWVLISNGTILQKATYGAGGIAYYNGTTTSPIAGGDGLIAIEFFSADPR